MSDPLGTISAGTPWAPLAVIPFVVQPLVVVLPLVAGLLVALGGVLLKLFRPTAVKQGLRFLWRQKVAVLVVLAVGGGGTWLVWAALAPAPAAVTGWESSADAWPMFRAGLGRRGALPGTEPPVEGDVIWAFDREVRTFFASPAVLGNRVYITSADKGVFRDRGALYCLDADTGGVVWKSAPPGFRATFSSPAVSGRYVVCGEGLHFTRDARIVCFDRERGGAVLWAYRTTSHVESSPCIAGGRVYVGAGDDGYYCFNLEPGPDGEADLVWHAPGEAYPDAETPPAVHDGKVYVGLGMGGKAVCCLHAETGDEIWRTETPYPVFTPPAVAGGSVFVGMGNGNFIETAEQVMAKEVTRMREAAATEDEIEAAKADLRPVGEVWCLDASTGEPRWRHRVGRTVLGAIATDGEALYFGSRDGHVYALTMDGEQIGRFNAHSPIIASPALTERHVYAVTSGGKLYALERATMRPVWETTLGTAGPFVSSPAVARGHVYVGTQGDGLLCVGRPGGEPEPEVWAGSLGGPGRSGDRQPEPLARRGARLWSFPKTDGESPPRIVGPVARLGDALLVPMADGPGRGLVCLVHDPEGRESPPVRWHFETPLGVHLSGAAGEDVVLLVDGVDGEEGRHLYCIDLASGEERWRAEVAAAASGRFILCDDAVYIQDRPGEVARFGVGGDFDWRRPVGSISGTPVCRESILVAAVEDPPSLVAMDAPTGATLWEIRLDAMPTTAPVVRDKLLLVGTSRGVEARHVVNGALAWSSEAGGAGHALTMDRERVAYVTPGGEVVVLDPAGGEVRRRIPGALPLVPPLLVRGTVLYAAQGALMAWPSGASRPRGWMDTSWLGEMTSAMVAVGGRVYFATDRRGLVCAGKWGR